jgi:hypothetical protein
MIVLDENILEDQRHLLIKWDVPIRQIGYELGRKGMKDDAIIPFLLQLRHPTFFTLDADFYRPGLCHSRYSLVYLAVRPDDAAAFARRLLRHPEFDTQAKRMGAVIRVSRAGLSIWRMRAEREAHWGWS